MKTLRRKDNNADVLLLKKNLTDLGLAMTEGSIFDMNTEIGVRIFQEKTGLEKDGIVGPKTWLELSNSPKLFNTRTSGLKWFNYVPYFKQRDNTWEPGGTCNVTSLAMVMAYLGVKPQKEGVQLEDELFLRLQEPDAIAHFEKNYPSLKKMGYKPRHIHGMLGWLAIQYGLKWKYSESTSLDDIDTFGLTVGPLIISGTFTRSGHIVCLVGKSINGDFIIHDPWGDWNSGYRDTDGQYRIYNREDMEQVVTGPSASKKRTHMISN